MTTTQGDQVRTAVSELEAELARVQSLSSVNELQVLDLSRKLTAATARLEAMDPWQVLHRFSTSANDGQTLGRSSRPKVDGSVNRVGNVEFGPLGMLCKAGVETKPDGSRLLTSCDILQKHRPMPIHFAYEHDVQFSGYLGVGMFPCPAWFKAIEGGTAAEIDGVEYMGGRAGNPGLDGKMVWKMTVIALPATSSLVQTQRELLTFITQHGIDPFAPNRWRWEKTEGQLEVLINGVSAAGIDRASFDKATGAKPGLWDLQMENAAKHFYVRHTWQLGENTEGKLSKSAGKVPADYAGSSFLINNATAYELKAA